MLISAEVTPGLIMVLRLPRGSSTGNLMLVDQGAGVKQCTHIRMTSVELWEPTRTGIATTLFLCMRLCTTESAEVRNLHPGHSQMLTHKTKLWEIIVLILALLRAKGTHGQKVDCCTLQWDLYTSKVVTHVTVNRRILRPTHFVVQVQVILAGRAMTL